MRDEINYKSEEVVANNMELPENNFEARKDIYSDNTNIDNFSS